MKSLKQSEALHGKLEMQQTLTRDKGAPILQSPRGKVEKHGFLDLNSSIGSSKINILNLCQTLDNKEESSIYQGEFF